MARTPYTDEGGQRWAPVQGVALGRVEVARDFTEMSVRLHIAEGWIPWEVHALAWRAYRDDGHGSQSAEAIAERGGFSWAELIGCLRGRYNKGATVAFAELRDVAEIP